MMSTPASIVESVDAKHPVQYHQQDTNFYCGPACAQMVLDSIGTGLTPQIDLFTDCNGSTLDPTSGWSTGPDHLEKTLKIRRPTGFAPFELAALGSEDAISRRICWAIHANKVAPVALVNGWGHWIVVKGYEASQAPTGPADGSYVIDGFEISDPSPPVPTSGAQNLPPPHGSSDGCGTGGPNGIRGIATEDVPYKTWQEMMSGVPKNEWKGKFLAVCVADQTPLPPAPPPGSGGVPHRRARTLRRKSQLADASEAATLADAGLRRRGLYARKGEWSSALAQASPGAGHLVQRLDRDDTFYSLVPFNVTAPRSKRTRTQRSARTSVVALIDARTGEYLRAARLPSPRSGFVDLNLAKAEKRVANRNIELGNDRGPFFVRKEAMVGYPHLVWRPCRESPSPFYPFYMFIVGSRRIYVRIDGEVFPSLTVDTAGN
jgi:hypothetical protein